MTTEQIPERPIQTSDIRALETAAADGWPGLTHAWVDGWLLRAGDGYTRRANSAVPLGGATRAASQRPETLAEIVSWYAAQDLPAQLALPDHLAEVPAGWNSWGETVVLGVDIAAVILPAGPPMVRISPTLEDSWLDLHTYRGEPTDNPTATPNSAVLTAVRDGELGFATLGLPTPLAIARGAITTAPDSRRWIGISCLSVAAEHRRHGLATLLVAELLRWGRTHGATHAYTQVPTDNTPALTLYHNLGFQTHHTHRYAQPSTAP